MAPPAESCGDRRSVAAGQFAHVAMPNKRNWPHSVWLCGQFALDTALQKGRVFLLFIWHNPELHSGAADNGLHRDVPEGALSNNSRRLFPSWAAASFDPSEMISYCAAPWLR